MSLNYQYNNIPNVLVGINFTTLKNNSIGMQSSFDFSPEWPSRPYGTNTNIRYNPADFPRGQTDVFLETNQQAKAEIGEGTKYALKSMMSLDGLFSPISFYPTPYSTTFSITKYPTPNCPFCYGTKQYSYKAWSDSITMSVQQTTAGVLNQSKQDKTKKCPFCEPVSAKLDKIYKSSSPSEIMPPFILASGDDLTIISRLPVTGLSGNPTINYTTLNPIVLATGEFSNFQNKQSGDLTGHCIDLVAFSMAPPLGLNDLRARQAHVMEKNYADYDANIINYREEAVAAGLNIPQMPLMSNNMRFFGLRGPTMLHGWGYDLEGYPVPNSSGEPLIQNGSIVRDTEGNIVGKNQKRKPDGTWTKPYKETTFYKGWAQQPGSWPVGPIDFRWDESAGIWTVGANYKMVHVVIEEDLVGTNPSRGQLIDSSYDNSPLPENLRRLVFVKDGMGLYSAPRGAALYCKYNSNNGFYEPIGHKPFITSGIIKSSNTVDIYKIYSKPNDPNIRLCEDPELEVYNTTFTNPLKFNVTIDDVALFTFLDGSWTIYSYNPDQ